MEGDHCSSGLMSFGFFQLSVSCFQKNPDPWKAAYKLVWLK